MSQEREQRRAGSGQPPPRDAREALARARRHGRSALAEALAAVQALLDAAALASRGTPSASHPGLAAAARFLQGLQADLEPRDAAEAASLLEGVAEALDVEIARWEQRAREDEDARAVLRAFLGLRELLWEFGVRPPAGRPRRGTRSAGAHSGKGSRAQPMQAEG